MNQSNRIPFATLLLIAINIAIAYWVVLAPNLVDSLGFRPDHPTFETALSCLFIHQNTVHLLGNMVFLAAVGSAVETATGAPRFLLVFIFSGLCGVVAHFFLASAKDVPLVGASGSIAGCAAYYSSRYYSVKVPVVPKVNLSIAWVTAIWAVLQGVGALYKLGDPNPNGSVAFWAHIGGLLGGLVLSFVFRTPDLGQRRMSHQKLDEMQSHGPVASMAAAEQVLKEHPGDARAVAEKARAAAVLGDTSVEIEALLELCTILPEQDRREVFVRLAELNALSKIPAVKRTRLAESYKVSQPDLAELLLSSVVNEANPDETQRPDAMLALAGLKMETDPATGQLILKDLETQYPLHPTLDLARGRGWLK